MSEGRVVNDELHYLKSILGNLREFGKVVSKDMRNYGLGHEILYDNIDWLDCYIDILERRSPSPRVSAHEEVG